jgi:hypothetical protein
MEIKFNNLPVTIETINVDGRKLTKQLLQQIPIEIPIFTKKDSDDLFGISELLFLKSVELKEYDFREKIIGWINLKLEKQDDIINQLGLYNYGNLSSFLIVLFVDSLDGKLKRTFITGSLYWNLFQDKYPQIYI